MLYFTEYNSPIGTLTVVSNTDAITGLWIDGQKYFASTVCGPMTENRSLPVLSDAVFWLDRYFSGERPSPSELMLSPSGTPFRRAVWDILCRIPYGSTVTYGEIAKELAARRGTISMSAQAIGGAVGHNPISIIIPCHRVIGRDGSLTGYAGGIEKKRFLLLHEGAVTASE